MMESSDHDLLVRIDERVMLLKMQNEKDHAEIKLAVAAQNCTSRVSALEGQLHGSWAVFGGLVALVGTVVAFFSFVSRR